MTTIRLIDAAHFYDPYMPHQVSAWNWLQDQLTPAQLDNFAEIYRADPPPKPQASPTPNATKGNNPLAVPYFAQTDNGPEGWRQCQSSAVAMCLAYLKVPGIKDDLDYLRVVQRYGDTTNQAAHRQALFGLKVPAAFRQNLAPDDLKNEILAGRPVAIGVLHRGTATAPTGGGHYIVVIGFTSTSWIAHDPFGEINLINGGWSQQGGISGRSQLYSFRNLNARWLVDGPATGWGWVFR